MSGQCIKCGKLSGDDWKQCKGWCPMKGESNPEADECTCGRYHSASEWKCYKCGKLVTAVVGTSLYCPRCECEPCQCKCDCDIGMCTHRANCRNNPLKASQNEMNEAKAYVISDSQEVLNFYKQTWNEAIEAVLKLGFDGREEMLIRELKK